MPNKSSTASRLQPYQRFEVDKPKLMAGSIRVSKGKAILKTWEYNCKTLRLTS
jgi:hypothetical protein